MLDSALLPMTPADKSAFRMALLAERAYDAGAAAVLEKLGRVCEEEASTAEADKPVTDYWRGYVLSCREILRRMREPA